LNLEKSDLLISAAFWVILLGAALLLLTGHL
jgi:hypothetical protein